MDPCVDLQPFLGKDMGQLLMYARYEKDAYIACALKEKDAVGTLQIINNSK